MTIFCPKCETHVVSTIKEKSRFIDFVEYKLPVPCFVCPNESCDENAFYMMQDLLDFDYQVSNIIVNKAIEDFTKRTPVKFKFIRQTLGYDRKQLSKSIGYDVYAWETGEEEIPEFAWCFLRDRIGERL